jgi:hypothetical protein
MSGEQSLTDFLLARIAEDEEWIAADGDCRCEGHDRLGPARPECADRIAAECEAKRQIMELAESVTDMHYEWEKVEAVLALPYADHPDYRSEWKP